MPEASEDVDVVIVGAGFAGLYALYQLRLHGFSVKAYEAGSGVGGTWYWNRYPGARVDLESVEYSYSFSDGLQQDWSWSERYAAQPELLRYLNHVADRFALRADIQFDTKVISATFNERSGNWTIRTSRGETVVARYCVMATGLLSVPQVPKIAGLDTFSGEKLLTSRWPLEPVDFAGKRVAVVGTGSSGIQCIPELAKTAHEVVVFQRTPNYCVPLRNEPMNREYEKAVKANYARWRSMERESFGGYVAVDFRPSKPNAGKAMEASPQERRAEYEYRYRSGGLCFYTSYVDLLFDKAANDTLVGFFHEKIRERIRNPDLVEQVLPRYPILTKRLCADTGYYETFERQNVQLVDTRQCPIEQFEKGGIRAGGRVHKADAVVFATGFDAVTGALTSIDIKGRNAATLKDRWVDGPRTHLGLMVAGFPNLFILDGPGSPCTFFSPVLLSEFQGDWISACIDHLRGRSWATIEASGEAEVEWVAHCAEVADRSLFSLSNNWYIGANIPGKARVLMTYLGGFQEYRRRCLAAAANDYGSYLVRRNR